MRSSSSTRRWPRAEGVEARALTVAAAVVGSAVVGGVMSSQSSSHAANKAADAQVQSTQAGIAAQQGQFDHVQSLLSPFVQAATGTSGTPTAASGGVFDSQAYYDKYLKDAHDRYYNTPERALEHYNDWGRAAGWDYPLTPVTPGAPGSGGSLGAQKDLIGLNGADAQQAAITQLQGMPAFQSQLKLGENRILQNASATGGLRGGNTQGAIGYFAPTLLAQQINDQYSRLGGITSLGQNAAAMTGNAGMQTGQGVSALLQQQGSALAGGALANGRAQSNLYSSMSGALGQYVGMGGGFGGSGSGVTPDSLQGYYAQTGAGQSGFGTGQAYGNADYGLYI